MEALALLPADLTAFVSPLARPAAPQQPAPDVAGPAPPGGDAFAQLFALLSPPLASGQDLPLGGKPLPLPLPEEAPTELPTVAESTTDGGASVLPELPLWFALRAEPAGAPAVASPPRSPTAVAGPALRDDAGFASSLGMESPLPAPPSSAPVGSTVELPFEGLPATIDPAASATPDSGAMTPSTSGTEALESATLDELLGRESPFAAPRAPAESRSLAPTPATPPPNATPVAQWLAPAGEAALQAAARAADSSTSGARPMRRGDGLGMAAPVASLTEPSSATPAADWLPPPVTGTGAANGTTAAAPTSVAQAPVDTGAPDWHEAFAGRIQWLVDQQIGEARIKLNPPELGAVDVKISLVDDKTFVQLTAATAAARDELTQSLPRLRDLFVASGLELGGASVQGGGGRGGQPGAQGGGYEPTPRYAPDLPTSSALLASETPRAERRGARGVDVFA